MARVLKVELEIRAPQKTVMCFLDVCDDRAFSIGLCQATQVAAEFGSRCHFGGRFKQHNSKHFT